jgi:hypothetical protein
VSEEAVVSLSGPSVLRALLVCACTILPASSAFASQHALADLDRDGVTDHVIVDARHTSRLEVRLSNSGTTHVLHSRRRLIHVVAVDLDHDRRPELVASDTRGRLHVWTHRRYGFKRYRNRDAKPAVVLVRSRRGISEDSETPEPSYWDGYASQSVDRAPPASAPSLAPSSQFFALARVPACIAEAPPSRPRSPPAF